MAVSLLLVLAAPMVYLPEESSTGSRGKDASACCTTFPTIMISEFYPCALNDDEYFVLSNPSDHPVLLGGWQLTDEEGSVSFLEQAHIGPGSCLSVSFNASSYSTAYGSRPTVGLDEGSTNVLCESLGSFRMGDDGDALILLDGGGGVVDSVPYGGYTDYVPAWLGRPVPSPRAGEVMKRVSIDGRLVDSGTSNDWMPFREYRYGYTSVAPFSTEVTPGNLTAFVSPDCSLDVICSMIGSASRTIRLCTYEFSSSSACSALLGALSRGVEVRLLVDGSPSGGIDDKAIVALSALAREGACVHVVAGNLDDGVVRHMSALHSKYMVIDSETIVVTSENFVPSGLPVDRVFGNRGWGIAATDGLLATHLSSVFDDDSRADRLDIRDWRDDGRYDPLSEPGEIEASEHPDGILPPLVTTTPVSVSLAFSPDASLNRPFLADVMASERSLLAEQFQADLMWTTRWSEHDIVNPLVAEAIDGARSGVSSRILLDSSWFNLERNEEVVEAVLAVSSAEALACQARLMNPSGPVTVLHNKGLVVDGRLSVVSSNNWVYASFARNRELAATIDSEEVARYFTSAFDVDWFPDVVSPVIQVPTEVSVPSGSWVNLSSECCTDDRMLAGVRWDVDADGSVDSRSYCLSVLMPVPGDFVIALTVTDSWGNEATERIVIHVTGEGYSSAEAQPAPHPLASVTAGAILAGLMVSRLLHRRASRRGR